MNKPTKIDDRTLYYRGFSIVRNYVSPRGTHAICETQQGWRVLPGRKAEGDWEPTIKDAVTEIDRLYLNYDSLSPCGKGIVDRAVLVAKIHDQEPIRSQPQKTTRS